jgi:hypothetical protein
MTMNNQKFLDLNNQSMPVSSVFLPAACCFSQKAWQKLVSDAAGKGNQ